MTSSPVNAPLPTTSSASAFALRPDEVNGFKKNPSDVPKDAEKTKCFSCSKNKTRKHSRELTQHELEEMVNDQAKKINVQEKKAK